MHNTVSQNIVLTIDYSIFGNTSAMLRCRLELRLPRLSFMFYTTRVTFSFYETKLLVGMSGFNCFSFIVCSEVFLFLVLLFLTFCVLLSCKSCVCFLYSYCTVYVLLRYAPLAFFNIFILLYITFGFLISSNLLCMTI